MVITRGGGTSGRTSKVVCVLSRVRTILGDTFGLMTSARTVINRFYGRSLLRDPDLSADDILFLIGRAVQLKLQRRLGTEKRLLDGANVALLFEKPSTRTRAAFSVAAHEQ